MKKYIKILYILLLIIPINIYAYSNKIIVGGDNIGIEVKSDGVYVVGFYEVNNKLISKEAGFEIGDIIKKINNNDIYNISSLNNAIDKEGTYTFNILRNNKKLDIKMNLNIEDEIIRTGLYIKDTIAGIGTLSYIDPETMIFGSLGHEIIESSSLNKFIISSGNIYKAEVSSIKKSTNQSTGEKNATIDKNVTEGEIKINEINGIYGIYNDDIKGREVLEVGNIQEIKKGEAYIKTVLTDNTINNYKINILAINENDDIKNILFEITDKDLLNKTGGVIQGMSGSPIIQNNKIIGVVNYVIVDDVSKGYGIFITTMLKEGDKILS